VTTWLWPAAALAACVIGLSRGALARLALGLGGALLLAWGVSALTGAAGPLLVRLPAPLPSLAFDPTGPSTLWLGLVGVLTLATALLLGSGARAARPDTAPLLHLTALAGAAVLTASTPFTLLLAWEAMSALVFVLFVASRPGRRVHATSYLLLLVSELGAAAVYALALLAQVGVAPGHGTPALALVIALLAVVGLGTKGALVPFQLWLPVVEPEAPGVVAGFLSGVLTAIAVVALLHVLAWAKPPALPVGAVLGALGLAGLSIGAFGAAFGADAKRVLAYGTIEALGATFLALGLGQLLRALGATAAADAATVAGVLLVFSHAGGKLVLFAATGAVEEQGVGRRLDAMGGLMARMPWVGATAFAAAMGLGGIPPLGTFVGEWLLLESLFMPLPHAGMVHAVLALLGALVAGLAALSLTAYLRWYGIAFLGPPRSEAAARARDAAAGRGIGGILALLALGAPGIGSPWLVPLFQHAYAGGTSLIEPLFRRPAENATLVGVGAAVGRGLPGVSGVVLTPDAAFSILSPWDFTWIALGLGLTVYLVLRLLVPSLRVPARRVSPWAGGTAAFTPRYTYTAEGLSQPLRLALAAWTGLQGSRRVALPGGTVRYRLRYADVLWRGGYLRLHSAWGAAAALLRRSQTGSVSQQVASILVALGIAVIIASYLR
jgi:hydrogenase-4 component B